MLQNIYMSGKYILLFNFNLIWMLLFSLMYRSCNCKAIVIWNMLLCRCGSKFHIDNAKNTKNSHICHSIDIRDLHNC